MPKRKAARGRGRGGKATAKQKSNDLVSAPQDVQEDCSHEDDKVQSLSSEELVEGAGIKDTLSAESEELSVTQSELENTGEEYIVIESTIEEESVDAFEKDVSTNTEKAREKDSSSHETYSGESSKCEEPVHNSDGDKNLVAHDYSNETVHTKAPDESEEAKNGDVQDEIEEVEEVEEVEEADEIEEVYLDKEIDDDVQYIDEEIEEGEQDLLDVIELGVAESNKNKGIAGRKEGAAVAEAEFMSKPSLSSKDELKQQSVEREDVEDNTFEEISEGSMDPMEQEEVVEVSDSEMAVNITTQAAMGDQEDKKKKRSSSIQEDETLADIFQVTENEDDQKPVIAKDKDNDDISDASLCDDDDIDRNDLSLEEISDDELDSSKKRKPEACSEQNISGEENKVTEDVDGMENVSDTKEEECVVEDTANKDTSKKRSIEDGEGSVCSVKRQKLSENQDENAESQAVSNEDAIVSTVGNDGQAKPSHSPPSSNVGEAKTNQTQPKPHRDTELPTYPQPSRRRGKIVQCTISRIDSEALGKVKDKEDSDISIKTKAPTIHRKYKDYLPSSVEGIFTEVMSTQPPSQGMYSLSLGPITMADFENTQFRQICMGQAEKLNLSFNSKMQGVLQIYFSKYAEVSQLISKLKSLDLGIRYLIMSLVYRTCQGETPQYWQAMLIFTYNQDSFNMMAWDTKDGKVRSRLRVCGVPESLSKDFVHLIFPEALYISTSVGKAKSRTLMMGFSSTKTTREICSCYELLLFNGEKVDIAPMDPGLAESQNSAVNNESDFIEENGTVIVPDVDDEAKKTKGGCQEEEKELGTPLEEKGQDTDVTHNAEKKNENVDKEIQSSADDVVDMETCPSKEDKAEGETSVEDASKTESGKDSDKAISQGGVENLEKNKEFGDKASENPEKENDNGENIMQTDGLENADAASLDSREQPMESSLGKQTEKPGENKSGVDKTLEIRVSAEDSNVDGLKSTEQTPLSSDSVIEGQSSARSSESKESSSETTAQTDSEAEKNDQKTSEAIQNPSMAQEEMQADADKENTEGVKEVESDKLEGTSEKVNVNIDAGEVSKNVEGSAVAPEEKDGNENSEIGKDSTELTIEGDSSRVPLASDDGKVKETSQGDQVNKNKERKNTSGKDSNLEDVSDDDMITTETKEAESDDEVIILKEEPPKKIVAKIDLTKEDAEMALESNDKAEEQAQEGKAEEAKDKVKEEQPLVDEDRLTMTDGDLEVVLESIDVEEVECPNSKFGDYRGKYYNRSYREDLAQAYSNYTPYSRQRDYNTQRQHRWESVRKEPVKRDNRKFSPDFNYEGIYGRSEKEVKMDSQKHYEKMSAIQPGSSVDKYSDGPARCTVPARESTSERRDNLKRDSRRKSPSPRRDVLTDHPHDPYQHSMPAYTTNVITKRPAYNFTSTPRPRPSFRDQGPGSSEPPSRDPQHPSHYNYKTNRTDSKYETPSSRREDYRAHKPVPQSRRSKSRSFSPLSPKSGSSVELLLRTSPQKSRTSTTGRKVSHSPISASSRSLSPVSKSPSPQPRPSKSSKYKGSPPRAYAERYSRSSRDRITSGQRRSRSPSPYKSWDRDRDGRRSRSPPYRRRASSPVSDRDKIPNRKSTVSAFRSSDTRRTNLDDVPKSSKDRKIDTTFVNKNSVYKKSSVSKGPSQSESKPAKSFNQSSTPSHGQPPTPVSYSGPPPTSTPMQATNYSVPSTYLPPPPQPPMFYSNPSYPSYQYNNLAGAQAFTAYSNQAGTPVYPYQQPSSSVHQSSSSMYSAYSAHAQTATTNVPASPSISHPNPGNFSGSSGKGNQGTPGANYKSFVHSQGDKQWSLGDGPSALLFQRILSKSKK